MPPLGWTTAALTQVIESYQSGFASGQKDVVNGLKHLRMNNIGVDGKLDLTLVRTVPPSLAGERHALKKGDILVCTTNSAKLVGKIAMFDRDGTYVFSNHLTRLTVLPEIISNRFLQLYLFNLWQRGEFEGMCKHWVNQSSIPKEKLLDLQILLPPLNEQRRIVEKLDKLLHRIDDVKVRLNTIPGILKRFRQSVLAAACSGRLTEDWQRPEASDSDVPTGWKWVRLEHLLPKNGIFDGPFGSNLKTSDYTDSGVRVIRLENIGYLRFFDEKKTYISEQKYKVLIKHTVGSGDIIFSSFIADEIRACVLPDLNTLAIAKADCFCLRPNKDLVDQKYLTYQLVSQESYRALAEHIHGATRPRVNTKQLRQLDIRICSLDEQREIVRRVEALLKTADQIEARYNKARAFVDKLTPAILAKAFSGELVPQDPNDEPASVLLERVHQQREPASGGSRGTKRKHPSAFSQA